MKKLEKRFEEICEGIYIATYNNLSETTPGNYISLYNYHTNQYISAYKLDPYSEETRLHAAVSNEIYRLVCNMHKGSNLIRRFDGVANFNNKQQLQGNKDFIRRTIERHFNVKL